MPSEVSTCLGVVRDTGRWVAAGWSGGGGGVEGRNGKDASFCKVDAVSIKPDNMKIQALTAW